MTDICQPLDRYIFGDLKQRAYGRWVDWHLKNLGQMSMANSLKLLIASWKTVDEETVMHAWEHLIEV
jgi:hypothetical protein